MRRSPRRVLAKADADCRCGRASSKLETVSVGSCGREQPALGVFDVDRVLIANEDMGESTPVPSNYIASCIPRDQRAPITELLIVGSLDSTGPAEQVDVRNRFA